MAGIRFDGYVTAPSPLIHVLPGPSRKTARKGVAGKVTDG
ncbi:hypothetical protein [Azospirillum palustre]